MSRDVTLSVTLFTGGSVTGTSLPPPYQVPSVWTPEHVMHRMVMAFDTLHRIPLRTGPAGYGSGWPSYVHEWGDLLAQEETLEAERKRRKYQDRDPMLPPSAHAVTLMDEAFRWPFKYLIDAKPETVQILRWARRRSRGHEGGSGVIRLVRLEAILICGGLKRDRVQVQ